MRKITLTILITLLICVFSTIAEAQNSPQVIPLPIPPTTRLGWNHDGMNITGFRLIIDGKPTNLGIVPRTPITATVPVPYVVPFPAMTPGNHIIVVQAYNGGTDGMISNELQVVIGVTAPTAPTQLTIIQTK